MRSENLIRETLLTLRERMTIIIVAHRLSTLDICDRIMVIQDGELKGFDTPAVLETVERLLPRGARALRHALMHRSHMTVERILFVSGTTIGGSGRSQRELASELAQRGLGSPFLVDDGHGRVARWVYGHLSDLTGRLPVFAWVRGATAPRTHGRPSAAPNGHRWAAAPRGDACRRTRWATYWLSSAPTLWSSTVSNVWRGGASSGPVRLMACRQSSTFARTTACAISRPVPSPTCSWPTPKSLQQAMVDRGHACAFVPSVIDISTTTTQSTREVCLTINPIESRGSSLVCDIAARLPGIRFALQESWPLDDAAIEALRPCTARPNVELGACAPPGPQLYRDAKLLLVPYRVNNRPRVIAEAQANGIPVVVADIPALVEAIGNGGAVVPLDDVDAWCSAILALGMTLIATNRGAGGTRPQYRGRRRPRLGHRALPRTAQHGCGRVPLNMALPNFFILGAGRSGTTSLAGVLRGHPEIFIPDIKEPSFYAKSFQWIKNPADFASLYAGSNEPLRGDASHVYLEDPLAPKPLRRFVPRAGS